MGAVDELRKFLAGIASGPVDAGGDVEGLLAQCWDDFHQIGGGMNGSKLYGRMEHVEWDPPRLSFRIERHGETVLGSTRGRVQAWAVNLDDLTALHENAGCRQLRPQQPSVDVKSLAHRIAIRIVDRRSDSCLRWQADGRVLVEIASLFPDVGGPKQTLAGRRKRFREALDAALAGTPWRRTKWTYELPA